VVIAEDASSGRSVEMRSKLDLVSFRHPAEQREDVLEGEGMGEASAAAVPTRLGTLGRPPCSLRPGGGLLQWARLPAASLLGPLAAAILVQAVGGAVTIPRAFLAAAQMVIGCLVARAITAPIVTGFASHWPVFLGVVALSVAAPPLADA
jgi:hypothetical protein